jgi:hypothetical protein
MLKILFLARPAPQQAQAAADLKPMPRGVMRLQSWRQALIGLH